jgi:hypothetical protein
MRASLQSWRIVSASVTGTRHKRLGEDCEDAQDHTFLPDSGFVCAIADGAGSAPAGKEGAQTVVEAALAEAVTRLSSVEINDQPCEIYLALLQNILQAARNALEARVQDTQPLSDFATTLLLVAMTPQRLVALQLGDGAIVVRRSNDVLETLSTPGHEEYINETHFVTDPDYLAVAQYIIEPTEDISGLAMLTDGLQMLALELAQHKAYPPFFLPLFTFAAQPGKAETELSSELEDFLATDRISQRTDDDKTLLLAVPTQMQANSAIASS